MALVPRLAKHPALAYATAGNLSVLSGKHMICASLCKPWAKHCLAALTLLFIYLVISNTIRFQKASRPHLQCVRFQFLEARDGSKVSAAGPPFITVMGIVDDGCHVQLGDYLPEPNRTYEFESDEGWDVTGFYFRTGDDPDMDPVVFMLEGSETCNGDWKVIGGSRRFVTAGGDQWWHAQRYATPDARYSKVVIDLKHPWHFWPGFATLHAIYAVFAVVGIVMAVYKLQNKILHAVFVMQALIFVLRTTSTVGSIMDHEYLDERFPHQWVHSLVVVVITYLFYRSESNVPWVLLLAGSKNIAVFFLEQLYWNRTGEKLKWLNVGYLYILASVFVLWTIHYRKKKAEELILSDQNQYRELWASISSQPGANEAILELASIVEQARERMPASHGQQRWDQSPAKSAELERRRKSEDGSWRWIDSQRINLHSFARLIRVKSHRSMMPMSASAPDSSDALPEVHRRAARSSAGAEQPSSSSTADGACEASGGEVSMPSMPAESTASGRGARTLGSPLMRAGSWPPPPHAHSGFHVNSQSLRRMSRQSSVLSERSAGSDTGEGREGRWFRPFQTPSALGSSAALPRRLERVRSRPVASVDQLYVQARGLHPVLIRKVQAWALASRGLFRVLHAQPRHSASHTLAPPQPALLRTRSNSSHRERGGVSLRLDEDEEREEDTSLGAMALGFREDGSARPAPTWQRVGSNSITRRPRRLSCVSDRPRRGSKVSESLAHSRRESLIGVERARVRAPQQGNGAWSVAQRMRRWARAAMGIEEAEAALERDDSLGCGRMSFLRWEEARGSEAEERTVFASLKNPERALEKLSRVYHGKVSALCDICRQSIYFQDMADLLAAMKVILSDEDVVVTGIKNRCSHDYDDMLTAGYRDVNITLNIRNPEACLLMCDLHVCEVQLILLDFAKVKTAAGHARYVAYRNMRAV